MDTHFPNLHDDLDALRSYARLVCPNRDNATQLLEQTLVEAITMAEGNVAGVGRPGWLLRLVCDLARRRGCKNDAPDGSDDPIVRALHRLPLAQREVIVLVDVLRLEPQLAAEILGCTEIDLGIRHTAARRALKLLLPDDNLPLGVGDRGETRAKGENLP
ncbi:hypothetical protein RGQ15_14925 [Paracoccus sp. MBLB3053]|uniref:RNA polymerase sigma factor 70 region 4 type 2 domain-containing protein n=1 Tax=Paracoccus aurantius TaxID=3073814 RepID=A0ABU2HVU4_9RHOB|nr:hypothetical protein [Paracoccus sp. MBLB3053]MDS9468857.1 hypothetical protein [Paracoccus sp. MBLB3053]